MNRIYYKLEIELQTPLTIGSGANENTDKDVIVDANGTPFIPATSLAGVLRSYIAATENGELTAKKLFGYISTERGNTESEEYDSLISVYDGLYQATAEDKGFFITNRDMVKLENKVGVDGAKFDMEAVEPGACFTAYLELREAEAMSAVVEEALAAMNSGAIRLGTKTTRGYGTVKLTAYKKVFTDIDEWLQFDMLKGTDWEKISLKESVEPLTIGLKSVGAISIREYSTRPSQKETTEPDYRTLALHDFDEESSRTPVIPGTSWAGAFRERFAEFMQNKAAVDELFGYVREGVSDSKAKKSNIQFSESRLSDGFYKVVTRNAIDRFTGGTKDGALYTEGTYYYGKTELVISLRKSISEKERKVLAACLADLHNGFMTIGGLTSVGRGLFEIESVNSISLSEDKKAPDAIYGALLERMKEVKFGE